MTDREKLKAIDDYNRESKELYSQAIHDTGNEMEKTMWASIITALDGVGEILER